MLKLDLWNFELSETLHLSLELENSILIRKLIHLIVWIYERFDKKKLVRAMQNYQRIKPNLLEKILETNFLNQSGVIVLFSQIFKWVTILFMINTTRYRLTTWSINVAFLLIYELFLKSEIFDS